MKKSRIFKTAEAAKEVGWPEEWKAIFLATAQRMCDKEEQTGFTLTELKATNPSETPGIMFNTLFFGDGVTSFDGWHGELNNREHVECRVIALLLCAAMCGD